MQIKQFIYNYLNLISWLIQIKLFGHAQERVWGVAYHIGADDVEWVSQYLDYMEKDGYQRTETTIHPYCNNQSE